MHKTLWTKNFTLLTLATTFGCVGGIAGGFALSFLVYDETKSTLASAMILAIRFIPNFVIPILLAPWLDRLPRKPFLVAADATNGILYALGGLYLLYCPFNYITYCCFSLLIASLGSFDMLTYDSIYPNVIPEGMESKGYTISSMLYPVLSTIMMPLAAILMEKIGVAWILILQGFLSLLAALLEAQITLKEQNRMAGEPFSFRVWLHDLQDGISYLKKEPGLRGVFNYVAFTNGISTGCGPLLVAFFRVTPGFSSAMYALFSVAESIGRSIGGVLHYNITIPPKKKFGFAFFVYQVYEALDMCLLWIPYPFMLLNRAVAGFLGINSAIMRQSAVQTYIPDRLRARVSAYQNILFFATSSVLTLVVGFLGELFDYRVCVSICAASSLLVCWCTIGRNHKSIHQIYETAKQTDKAD